MFELLDRIFEEFGVEFDTTKYVDSFSAMGYDGEKVIFNKNDYIDYGFNVD